MRIDTSVKENNFDFLRLALAVLVIFSHSFPLGAGSDIHEPLRVLTHGQMTLGAFAVDLFFVMSGFLIAGSAERSRSLGSYLKKRVARIYPAFVVSAVVMAVVVLPLAKGTFAEASWAARLMDFSLQTLRLREFHVQGAFAHNPYPGVLNGSVWSIQYEFGCYLGVAMMAAVGLLKRRGWVLACFVASLVISVAFQTQGWIFGGKFAGALLGSPQLWARLLPFYLAGVVFYLFRDSVRLNAWGASVAMAALIAACWLPVGWTAVFPLAGTYLVFYVAFAKWIPMQRAGKFGDFSYGTYLYAFPVEQLLVMKFGHAMTPWLLFAMATPLSLIAAVVSWYVVERRFLRSGRRRENLVAEAASEDIQIPALSMGRLASSTVSGGTSEA
jgi:peptidoglycan/LPS O-acetylase OafA/YrhL